MTSTEADIKDKVTRTDSRPVGLLSSVRTVSSNVNIDGGEVLLVDSSSSDITVTLPQPQDALECVVKKKTSDNNVITVATPSGVTIDGANNYTISNQYVSKDFISDGSDYFIID